MPSSGVRRYSREKMARLEEKVARLGEEMPEQPAPVMPDSVKAAFYA